MAAQPPGTGVTGQVLDVAGGDVQQRDVGVGGQQRPRLVDAGLPGALGDPDQGAHQKTCKANHNAAVEATSDAGTVSAPSLRNSRVSTSSSWAWTIRRHSSVASEPT